MCIVSGVKACVVDKTRRRGAGGQKIKTVSFLQERIAVLSNRISIQLKHKHHYFV